MDKIKTVKIKNPNGSVSEETYVISVDANNVDMKNGKDLQVTIGNINVDKDGSIAEQLGKYKDYDSDIEALYTDVNNLEAADTDLEKNIIDLQVNKINKIDIIDNLNSSSNTKVLSAKQGKVLGDAVTALEAENIKKKAYFFDTVADMKAANLKNGDYACTLGYYEINDGGSSLYKIRTITDDDVIDDGSIISMSNPSLIAELVFDTEIDVKQFGAKGDNETDDTDRIKATIEFAEKQMIIDYTNPINKRTSHFKINFSKGNYLISDTIIFNVQRFDFIGHNCIIVSNVSDGKPAIQLKGGNAMSPDRIIKGILIYNNTNDRTNSVGWFIGTKTYGGQTHLTPASAFKMEECGAVYFGTGYMISHNAYTFTLDNCGSYSCKYTIKTNENLINSGENIIVNDCVFASTTDTDVYVTSPNMQLRFVNTSFDQGQKLLYVNYPGAPNECNLITFTACHFEPLALTTPYIEIGQYSSSSDIIIDKSTTFLKTTANNLFNNLAYRSNITIRDTNFCFYDNYPNYIANNDRTQLINCVMNKNILSDPYSNLVIDPLMTATSIGTNGEILTNGQSFMTNKCWIYLDKDTYNQSLQKTTGTFVNITTDNSIKPTGSTKSFKVSANRANIVGFLAPYNGIGSMIKGKFQMYFSQNITGKIIIRGVYWDGLTLKNIGYPGTVYQEIDLSTVQTGQWIEYNFPVNSFKVSTNAKMVGFMIENQGANAVTSNYSYNLGNVILQSI